MIDWIYIAGGTLYVAMVFSSVWVITREQDFRELVHYYKPDKARGGYVDLNDRWVERTILWRQWGWYGVVVVVGFLLPFIFLYVFVSGRFIEPLLNSRLQARRKEVPVSLSGGDGSSREAAIVISADNTQDGIKTEYKYIARKHGLYKVAWKRHMQIKASDGGKEYDVITIVLSVDGTNKKFWFDITSFSGKWRLS